MKDIAHSADSNPVHFNVDGKGAPALVFVHGWSCDRTYWSRQMRYFAGRFQVVTIDLAGHGESGDDRQAWTMLGFGDDVVTVVEKLALGKVALIGHSMGGDVIVEAALRLPDRVVGLVWVDTYSTLGESDTPEEIEEFLDPFRRDFVTATRNIGSANVLARFRWRPGLMGRRRHGGCTYRGCFAALEHAGNNHDAILAGRRELTAPVVAINPAISPPTSKHSGVTE